MIRTRTGRALQAIRDRDVAAEVMGIPEAQVQADRLRRVVVLRRHRRALFASFVGKLPPETWDLILSVEFIAILLIGGAGTTAGRPDRHVLRRAVAAVRRGGRRLDGWPGVEDNPCGGSGTCIISTEPGDFGFISTADIAPGFPLPVNRLDELIYGMLVVVFLLFEPLGLYGIWIKIRNYWKGWPFSY